MGRYLLYLLTLWTFQVATNGMPRHSFRQVKDTYKTEKDLKDIEDSYPNTVSENPNFSVTDNDNTPTSSDGFEKEYPDDLETEGTSTPAFEDVADSSKISNEVEDPSRAQTKRGRVSKRGKLKRDPARPKGSNDKQLSKRVHRARHPFRKKEIKKHKLSRKKSHQQSNSKRGPAKTKGIDNNKHLRQRNHKKSNPKRDPNRAAGNKNDTKVSKRKYKALKRQGLHEGTKPGVISPQDDGKQKAHDSRGQRVSKMRSSPKKKHKRRKNLAHHKGRANHIRKEMLQTQSNAPKKHKRSRKRKKYKISTKRSKHKRKGKKSKEVETTMSTRKPESYHSEGKNVTNSLRKNVKETQTVENEERKKLDREETKQHINTLPDGERPKISMKVKENGGDTNVHESDSSLSAGNSNNEPSELSKTTPADKSNILVNADRSKEEETEEPYIPSQANTETAVKKSSVNSSPDKNVVKHEQDSKDKTSARENKNAIVQHSTVMSSPDEKVVDNGQNSNDKTAEPENRNSVILPSSVSSSPDENAVNHVQASGHKTPSSFNDRKVSLRKQSIASKTSLKVSTNDNAQETTTSGSIKKSSNLKSQKTVLDRPKAAKKAKKIHQLHVSRVANKVVIDNDNEFAHTSAKFQGKGKKQDKSTRKLTEFGNLVQRKEENKENSPIIFDGPTRKQSQLDIVRNLYM